MRWADRVSPFEVHFDLMDRLGVDPKPLRPGMNTFTDKTIKMFSYAAREYLSEYPGVSCTACLACQKIVNLRPTYFADFSEHFFADCAQESPAGRLESTRTAQRPPCASQSRESARAVGANHNRHDRGGGYRGGGGGCGQRRLAARCVCCSEDERSCRGDCRPVCAHGPSERSSGKQFYRATPFKKKRRK